MYQTVLNKAIILVTIIIASAMLFFYGFRNYYMHGDALGYYMYLPATFIYDNNKHLENLPENNGINPFVLYSVKRLAASPRTPKGYVMPQYTYGIALMEAPFFFVVHGYEKITGKQANGYSDSYNLMLLICSLTYAILGLLLVYNILKKYFSSSQSLYGVILIFLGTNLFWFSLLQGGMAHAPIFFLYALLMLVTIKLYERPKLFYFLSMGFITGLITIIRPIDMLCMFIPLLYNVYNKETYRQRILFIKKHWPQLLLLILAFCIPIIPQLLYWKEMAGSYFFYSYGDQSFNWGHPRILEGLFYFHNGWLAYTPIMIFALAGLFLYRIIKQWAWCLWIILPLYIYAIYSWCCYAYPNGFGSRPMIHLYPLLAIPLTAFIRYISTQKLGIKFIFSVICIFFVAVNICNSMQKLDGFLDTEESNITYNIQTFFKFNLGYNDLVVADIEERQPDTNKIIKMTTVCKYFDDSLSDHYIHDTVFGTKYIYHMGADDYSPGIQIKYTKQLFKNARWIKCSGKFMYPDLPGYYKHMLVITATDRIWKACKIENKIPYNINVIKNKKITLYGCETNIWGNVYYFVKIPETMREGDEINMFVWNTGKQELFIDDLCLELYK